MDNFIKTFQDKVKKYIEKKKSRKSFDLQDFNLTWRFRMGLNQRPHD